MKNCGAIAMDDRAEVQTWLRTSRPESRPGLLHWVTTEDIQELNRMLQRGWNPVDFDAKLFELAGGSLTEQQIEKNCRLFIALLEAANEGAFRQATKAEYDRLLRVLAYVRKTDDAIPDYLAHGFADDQQEVHAATVELAPLLATFKSWRLRHQVPGMWRIR